MELHPSHLGRDIFLPCSFPLQATSHSAHMNVGAAYHSNTRSET